MVVTPFTVVTDLEEILFWEFGTELKSKLENFNFEIFHDVNDFLDLILEFEVYYFLQKENYFQTDYYCS